MKNVLLLTLTSALFLVTACRQVNKELVGNMEAELAKIKGNIPVLDSFSQHSSALLQTIETAPLGQFRVNPEYQFSDLYFKASAIYKKSTTVKTMCEDMSQKLDSLIQGYSNGDIKEDSVKVEFQAITQSLEGLPEINARMQPFMDEVAASFAKSMEKWNALPESERNKGTGAFSAKPGGAIGLFPNTGGKPQTAPQKPADAKQPADTKTDRGGN